MTTTMVRQAPRNLGSCYARAPYEPVSLSFDVAKLWDTKISETAIFRQPRLHLSYGVLIKQIAKPKETPTSDVSPAWID
ncbi:MAG: hypothetical protein ACI8WB_000982 [Phenylobacterium sp.]|jgi:hypothetical protein